MKSNKRLLFCPKCNTEMHILELTLTEKNIIKYKCQCGILSEEIESFLSKNTYYFTYGSSYEFSNKSFINELNNQFLNLNFKAPKCNHGNEVTGFCDTCSEYLCEKCMHKHLIHIIFDTNNIKCEIEDLFPDSYDEFMTSLEQNHSIIISQINSTIEQLQSYKELIEKEYNNTVNKNKILYEIAIRLKNNYEFSKYFAKNSNFISYVNYYNFSRSNEKKLNIEDLSTDNMFDELGKIKDYWESNYFIIPRQNREQFSIGKISFEEKESKDDENALENKKMELMSEEENNKSNDEELNPEFESLNNNLIIKENKNMKLIKTNPFDLSSLPIDEVGRNIFFYSYFYLLPHDRICIYFKKKKLYIFSLKTFQKEIEIDVDKIDEYFQYLSIRCLSNGSFVYFSYNVVGRINIHGYKYTIERGYLKVNGDISEFFELDNKNLLFYAYSGEIYILKSIKPFKIKKIIQVTPYLSGMQYIGNELLLIPLYNEQGYYLLSLRTKKKVKEFKDLTFTSFYSVKNKNKIFFVQLMEIRVFNTITLEIETIIDGFNFSNFSNPPENQDYGICSVLNDFYQINLNTFEMRKLETQQEKRNETPTILALPQNKLMVIDTRISLFEY